MTACQKQLARTDDPSFVIQPPVNVVHDSCRIQTAYYYGGSGGINDTANFFYTGTRLISVMGSGAGVLYTYNGDQLFSMAYS